MKERVRWAAIAGVFLTIIAFAAYWYLRSRAIETTDDAYVRGEITAISSRVSGYAVEVLTDDNLPVTAGQVLVRIDPRDFRMSVERSQAALDQARAELARIGAQRELQQSKIQVAEAVLRAAQAQGKNADVMLERSTTLAAKSVATQASVDTNTAAAAQAHAAIDQASANLAYEHNQTLVINSQEDVARAQVASAEAALLTAKFALRDTEIWSPIDGIVANLQTRVGTYVVAGTHMMSVVPIGDLWIDANYRETQVGRMKPGDPVRINIDTHPQVHLCGYVESIAPASGSEFALIPPDNATGNFTKIVRRFTVRIRFSATEKNATLARPGVSTETAVVVSRYDGDAPSERARRLGCSFDSSRDVVNRALTKLPEHPGIGRARPQGPAGTQLPSRPTE